MLFSRVHVPRVVPFRAAVVILAMVGAMSIAGCGPNPSTVPVASSTPTVAPSAATASTGAATASTGTGAGSCGEATAALVKQHLASRTDIVSVTTEGGCHDATIVTSLGPTDSTAGLAICDSAAEVAYTGDISSITVLAASTKELAIGIKGQPCIGEP